MKRDAKLEAILERVCSVDDAWIRKVLKDIGHRSEVYTDERQIALIKNTARKVVEWAYRNQQPTKTRYYDLLDTLLDHVSSYLELYTQKEPEAFLPFLRMDLTNHFRFSGYPDSQNPVAISWLQKLVHQDDYPAALLEICSKRYVICRFKTHIELSDDEKTKVGMSGCHLYGTILLNGELIKHVLKQGDTPEPEDSIPGLWFAARSACENEKDYWRPTYLIAHIAEHILHENAHKLNWIDASEAYKEGDGCNVTCNGLSHCMHFFDLMFVLGVAYSNKERLRLYKCEIKV